MDYKDCNFLVTNSVWVGFEPRLNSCAAKALYKKKQIKDNDPVDMGGQAIFEDQDQCRLKPTCYKDCLAPKYDECDGNDCIFCKNHLIPLGDNKIKDLLKIGDLSR